MSDVDGRTSNLANSFDVLRSHDLCMFQAGPPGRHIDTRESRLQGVQYNPIGAVSDGMYILYYSIGMVRVDVSNDDVLTTCHPSLKNNGITRFNVFSETRMNPFVLGSSEYGS